VGDAAEAVRVAKWTAIILGGVVLLVVIAAFVLTSVVDPNRYRGQIEAIVADLAGKPFVIEGDVAITWYPWLGIRTGLARLDNPAIVDWQSINVAAKLWPLLHGEVVADRVRLQSPHIHLRRDAQGHGNWENLGSSTRAAATGVPADGSAPGAGGTPPNVGGSPAGSSAQESQASGRHATIGQPRKPSRPVQIAGVEIRDGTIDYVDEATGQQVTLANVDLDIGEFRADHPLPVHARFLAHTQSLPPNGVWVELDAPKVAIRPNPLAVSAPKLTLKVANAQAEGDLTYEQIANANRVWTDAGAQDRDTAYVRAHGNITLHSPSLRELATALGLNQSLPHDPTTLGPVELNTTWTYDNGAITAKPLALKLDEVSLNGWLERTAPPKSMWGFELHGDRIDLSRYTNIDSKNKKPFELPVEALHAINANGSVIFDQLVFADTHMTDVRLKVQTPEGNP
jgi:AsmA protein